MLPLLVSMVLAGGLAADPTYLVILGPPEQFSAQFPPAAPTSARQIGFGEMLFTLGTPVADLRRKVEADLDAAEKTGYPLLLHVDDWNFPPPSTDPEWVEWTAFPKPGEAHGPLVRRRWINWGSWMVAGPPPNYESPKFREYVRAQIEDGVVKPLAERLKVWQKDGRAYLFAGLVVGWESGYYSMSGPVPNPRPKAGADTFEDSEVVTTGYAALTRRGWTAEKLAAEAKTRGVTEQALFRELMCGVLHDYTAYLCGLCVQDGLPRERLYTHFTAYATIADPAMIAGDGRLLPVATGVNEFSRPGLTMTQPWTDREKAVAQLRAAGRQEWGAVELEVTPGARTEEATLEHFDWLATHGARVLCLFGWWDAEGSTFAVKGTGAVAGMKRWLAEPPETHPD